MRFVTDLLARRAALAPDRAAFIDPVSGTTLSFAALDDRASRAATLLAAHGIAYGDRVGILCRNRVEFFEILFACARIGAILVPLNWRMPAAEIAPLIADCEARLVLFGAEDADRACAAAAERAPVLIGLDDDYATQRDACEPHAGRSEWPSDETWYLIYTSGTTGRPKGVIQTYAMALVNFINITQAIGLRGTDSTLNFLPLFHTAGINLHTLPVLFAGGTNYILPGFDPGQLLALVNAGKMDVFIGVPAVYRELTLHPDFGTTDLTRVRHWACGGAPLPDILVQTFADRGAVVCNGFGMTETGPTAFLSDPENALDKIGSVGRTWLLTEARIATPDGDPLPAGETGEIQFHGPGLTPGYWNRPEETAKLFTADGWLKSGDLGHQDPDGFVFVAGRIKEMYISGGENVYPAEVENVLARHPAVLEAAITGHPDDKWGEVGCAHVILRQGKSADGAGLAAWCRSHLAAYKVPRHWVFAVDFPRTAAGKVQKHLLPGPGVAS
jgi:fatty-acyl-CoA synthase